MSNTTTTRKPLRFATESHAAAWLKETRNCGLLHHTGVDWIVVQFAEGFTWAFTTPEEMALLPEW